MYCSGVSVMENLKVMNESNVIMNKGANVNNNNNNESHQIFVAKNSFITVFLQKHAYSLC